MGAWQPSRGSMLSLDQPDTGRMRWVDHAAAIVDDAVIICTIDGRIAEWSLGAETLFGLPADDAVGCRVDILASVDHQDSLHGILRDIASGGAPRRTDAVLRHRDGTALTVRLGAAPVVDAGGALRGVSLFVRDVTQQHRMATELAAARTRLAGMQGQISQLTRFRRLEPITLDLAHELNQPLAAIGNYLRASQLLIAGKQGPELERVGVALDAAVKQSVHAGQIVSNLRAFVQRGETEKQIEAVASLVDDAVALAAPSIEEHGVRVALDFDPAAAFILADRVQILQVLGNLIRNAAEAMHDMPRRELSIAAHRQGDTVEISVADTGKGLPEALRDHLFEPFLTTRSTGTGLGLTICNLIVEAQGGRLSCRSAPEGGSVFCFSVPRPTQPSTEPPSAPPP